MRELEEGAADQEHDGEEIVLPDEGGYSGGNAWDGIEEVEEEGTTVEEEGARACVTPREKAAPEDRDEHDRDSSDDEEAADDGAEMGRHLREYM